jgi:Prefoldin subunit
MKAYGADYVRRFYFLPLPLRRTKEQNKKKMVWGTLESKRTAARGSFLFSFFVAVSPTGPPVGSQRNMAQQEGGPRRVDLSTMGVEQLDQLRQQLVSELSELDGHMRNLTMVVNRFLETKEAVQGLTKVEEGRDIMLPLTSSVYVPAKIHDVKHVVVDIGTGYYAKNVSVFPLSSFPEAPSPLPLLVFPSVCSSRSHVHMFAVWLVLPPLNFGFLRSSPKSRSTGRSPMRSERSRRQSKTTKTLREPSV